jgi:uncharacterized protein YjbI with pentapeptide repeats
VGADCDGTDFSNANLTEADLEGADLFEAIFDGARLVRANLSKVHATWCSFDSANLIGSYLWGGRFHHARFIKATLRGRSFFVEGTRIRFRASDDLSDDDSDISESHLHPDGADFGGCNFSHAILTNLDFGESDLSDTELAWCDLRNSDMRNVRFLSSGSLVGSDLSGAEFPLGTSFNEQIDNARDLIRSCRLLHSIILTFGAYAATAVWFAQRSADGLFNLELIGLEVKEKEFLFAGTLILTSLSLHFQIHLQRVWEWICVVHDAL